MILVFGGAYQGKKEFVFRTFGLSENNIEYAGGKEWKAGNKKIICCMEGYIRALAEEGIPAVKNLEAMMESLEDKIVIITDISQGIVPMDRVDRLWREENGRAMSFLAGRAEEVYRLFCGIESRVK